MFYFDFLEHLLANRCYEARHIRREANTLAKTPPFLILFTSAPSIISCQLYEDRSGVKYQSTKYQFKKEKKKNSNLDHYMYNLLI